MLKQTIKLGGILFLIACATALLLAVTNSLTADKIAQLQLEKKNEAMAQVIAAENYNLIESQPESYELYQAANGDTTVGYAVSIYANGYGGNISMMVGVNPDLTVNGVSITDMSETPGLGDNAKKPEFTDLFKGKSENELALTNEGGTIQALSGATITSLAVTNAVRSAVEIVSKEISGGAYSE
ncbi:MAG: RnfABCDGE type electron transport complex subunit G [Clostridia bacterium]|nr:RnfABCDGE type electron transport complex subunit G [Clostridia bacterium]